MAEEWILVQVAVPGLVRAEPLTLSPWDQPPLHAGSGLALHPDLVQVVRCLIL